MNLLSKAQNQLKEINAKDIKLLLKNRYPNEYSKMLIDDNAIVKRKDYYASQLEYTKAEKLEKELYIITYKQSILSS